MHSWKSIPANRRLRLVVDVPGQNGLISQSNTDDFDATRDIPSPNVNEVFFTVNNTHEEDILLAENLAQTSFQNFANSPLGPSMISSLFASDSAPEHSKVEKTKISHIIRSLMMPNFTNAQFPPFQAPSCWAVRRRPNQPAIDNDYARQISSVTFFLAKTGNPNVLVSDKKGLRDLLLICQDCFADAVVLYSKSIGLKPVGDDPAKQLVGLVCPDRQTPSLYSDDNPAPIDLIFAGQPAVGYAR